MLFKKQVSKEKIAEIENEENELYRRYTKGEITNKEFLELRRDIIFQKATFKGWGYYRMRKISKKPLGRVLNAFISILILLLGFLLIQTYQIDFHSILIGIAIILMGLFLMFKTVIKPLR